VTALVIFTIGVLFTVAAALTPFVLGRDAPTLLYLGAMSFTPARGRRRCPQPPPSANVAGNEPITARTSDPHCLGLFQNGDDPASDRYSFVADSSASRHRTHLPNPAQRPMPQ